MPPPPHAAPNLQRVSPSGSIWSGSTSNLSSNWAAPQQQQQPYWAAAQPPQQHILGLSPQQQQGITKRSHLLMPLLCSNKRNRSDFTSQDGHTSGVFSEILMRVHCVFAMILQIVCVTSRSYIVMGA